MTDRVPHPQDPAAAPARLPAWLRAIAALPLPLLYAVLSGLMFLVFRVVRLRRKVVEQNLRDCFPDRSAAELRRLARDHYRQTGENIAETLKAISMPREELAARVAFRNIDLARGLLAQGRPVILVAAHQANWEWVLHALSLGLGSPLDVGYKPIRSPGVDRLMRTIRTRFGTHMVPAKELLPDLLKRRSIVRGIAMLADQEPTSSEHQHWLTFLGRETAFYMGAEQMARATRYPALFVALRRLRRGWYEIEFLPLALPGETLAPGEFTTRYARLVEAEILAAPSDWTWGHRRWKLRRSLYSALGAGSAGPR